MSSQVKNDDFIINFKKFKSRLIVGTGKYQSLQQTKDAIEASGADMVTVAVRRVNINDKKQEMLQDYLDPLKYTYLPNTAGCFNSYDAIKTLNLARDIGNWNLVKLEILTNTKTLYPDVIETINAAKELIKSGFEVMVYTNDDPVIAQKLEDIGCVAIMPLGAPIGSGLGIQNILNIKFIIEQTKVPVIIDAGVGSPSHATIAMELGCEGVLMNSAIAHAKNPILMAEAMKHAVISGRYGFLSGKMNSKNFAEASSPMDTKHLTTKQTP